MEENTRVCDICGSSAPLGYNINNKGLLVINPHEVETVVLIF